MLDQVKGVWWFKAFFSYHIVDERCHIGIEIWLQNLLVWLMLLQFMSTNKYALKGGFFLNSYNFFIERQALFWLHISHHAKLVLPKQSIKNCVLNSNRSIQYFVIYLFDHLLLYAKAAVFSELITVFHMFWSACQIPNDSLVSLD